MRDCAGAILTSNAGSFFWMRLREKRLRMKHDQLEQHTLSQNFKLEKNYLLRRFLTRLAHYGPRPQRERGWLKDNTDSLFQSVSHRLPETALTTTRRDAAQIFSSICRRPGARSDPNKTQQ